MSFYPISDEDVIKFIRVIMGNISSEEIPDEVILTFWHMNKAQYPEDEPLALYATIYNILFFYILPELINNGNVEGGERKEKEASIDIQVKYGKTYDAWMQWWKWFNTRPPIPDLDLKATRLIVINGVRNDDYYTIEQNTNSRTGGAYLGMNGGSTVRNGRNGYVLQRGRWNNGLFRR